MLRWLRITTWNFRSALDRKLKVVDAIDADVLTIQECSADTALSRLQECNQQCRNINGRLLHRDALSA